LNWENFDGSTTEIAFDFEINDQDSFLAVWEVKQINDPDSSTNLGEVWELMVNIISNERLTTQIHLEIIQKF